MLDILCLSFAAYKRETQKRLSQQMHFHLQAQRHKWLDIHKRPNIKNKTCASARVGQWVSVTILDPFPPLCVRIRLYYPSLSSKACLLYQSRVPKNTVPWVAAYILGSFSTSESMFVKWTLLKYLALTSLLSKVLGILKGCFVTIFPKAVSNEGFEIFQKPLKQREDMVSFLHLSSAAEWMEGNHSSEGEKVMESVCCCSKSWSSAHGWWEGTWGGK